MIRGKNHTCPFGLSITDACNSVGGPTGPDERIAVPVLHGNLPTQNVDVD